MKNLVRVSRCMLLLSESDVRSCLPVPAAIEANRKALGSLRLKRDGGAEVPTRVGLPYFGKDDAAEANSGVKSAADWTLFKPAAYYPPKHEGTGDGIIMGMKLVSVRSDNPSVGKPTVPATVMMVDAISGQVSAILGATYLTAARTASGSAIATEICTSHLNGPINLVVFGAGLQAELHIDAIRCVKKVGKITIVNRTRERAERLKSVTLAKAEKNIFSADIDTVLLGDDRGVMQALKEADVICTTTNASTPLFPSEWVKTGCHVNGVGSYTAEMEEIDSNFSSTRCQVVVDTQEAINVGDLKSLSFSSSNFVGLLGDVISGNAHIRPCSEEGPDCTFFKSVGTAIQDVITAHAVMETALARGIGTEFEM